MKDKLPMQDAILHCEQIQKIYTDGEREVRVLECIDFSVMPGESVAIIGRSGSGKTTLLNLLGGLEMPSAGKIHLDNTLLHGLSDRQRGYLRNRVLGFIFQFHHLLPEFTAVENVAMPLLIQGIKTTEARNRSLAILDRVGLSHQIKHKPGKLSGGERQRVAIARALVTAPKCILADEPTGNLDSENAQAVYKLMLELMQEHNTSCVIVTHDLNLAKQMNKRVTLERGVLVDYAG